MTNNFASRHMEHIAVLTKQLHECQIGSELTPMFAVLQNTVSLHVSHTKAQDKTPVSGFEEVLRSLPIHEIKSFVEGIQMLLDRAKSLQDLILMTERENEKRRTEARIKAERQASEQRIRELVAENARLKAMVNEQQNYALDSESLFAPPRDVNVKKGRMAVPKLGNPTSKIGLSAAVSRASVSKLSSAERDLSHGHPGSCDSAQEDSIDSRESLGREAEYETNLYPRKRRISTRQEPMRRCKLQTFTLHPGESTETSTLEEDHFQFRRGPVHTSSPTHLENFAGETTSTYDMPPYVRSQREAEPYHFGSSPIGRDTSGAAIFHGDPSGQTGHPSMELGLEDATSLQNSIKPRGRMKRDASKRERRTTARPSPNNGGLQADAAHDDNVEQELEPEKIIQQPSESTITTQEYKLVENMEQMQGMLEKLSLLLQVGQHAIGAHERM